MKAILCRAIVLSGALAATGASAQQPPDVRAPQTSAQALPLNDALGLLSRENLRLVAARLDVSATRADAIAAGLMPNPGLSISTSLFAHGTLSNGTNEVTVVLDQVLPIAGQIGLRKEVATTLTSAAEREYSAIAWNMVADARVAYVDLQIVQARSNALAAAITDLDRVDEIVTQRTAAGANSQYDRLRVGAEKTTMTGRATELRSDLLQTQTGLAEAIAPRIDARTLVATADLEEPKEPPTDTARLVATALARRPEVTAAHLRITAGDQRVTFLRRQYIPSPDLALGYSRWVGVPTGSGTTTGGGGAFYAGVSFPLPIFDHGQGTIDRGRAEVEVARTRRDAVELTIRRETLAAAETLRIRLDGWRRHKEASTANIDRMRAIVELSYREGRATVLELLDAYATHYRMRDRGIELLGAAIKSSIELDRALGPASTSRR
jgi:outer membrane protein, heavy metal efflux system